jgi:hypothetical protein
VEATGDNVPDHIVSVSNRCCYIDLYHLKCSPTILFFI